ncbi:hypothetical protein I2I05_21065 [Hymenobacter sp. BT683]|uniref:Uncharacterized protein n=1 Tax=Hymenobacter jeongseonensis TaxID=2791027 RepID=A0ABS0INE9_9BACT|nr:hypothetical protein [Hymenobacter jeongseonensis]MBF9239896.1 hypothetical protein [Hymenobacter jeongseonensis]
MKKPSSKFGLAALVSQPAAAIPKGSVDDLLFAPVSTSPLPGSPVVVPNSELTSKTRFTNTLPTSTYVQLHRLAFWDRRDMSSIIDAALQEYFVAHPDADKPLPEPERVKRKLPTR